MIRRSSLLLLRKNDIIIRMSRIELLPGAPLLTEKLREEYPEIVNSLGGGALLLHQSTSQHEAGGKLTANSEAWRTGQVRYACLAPYLDEVAQRNGGVVAYEKDYLERSELDVASGEDGIGYKSEQVALEELIVRVEAIGRVMIEQDISYYGDHPFDDTTSITFIDHQSYNEAAAGVAERWKYLLEQGATLAIVSGEVARQEKEGNPDKYKQPRVKSDEYLLERVLWHFSEDELQRYAPQFIVDLERLPKDPDEDTRLIFLDDWIISGEQMSSVTANVLRQYPAYCKQAEVQLIVASPEHLNVGFITTVINHIHPSITTFYMPVSAYFRAHYAPDVSYGASISGSYSSVDYGFRDPLNTLTSGFRSSGYIDQTSPWLALANIQQPYRMPGVSRESLHQTQLLKQYIKELTGVEK